MAQLSEPLHATMNGKYIGIPEVWPDVNKRTFERLAQFAYTGDYTVPKPLRVVSAVNEQEALENEPSSGTLNGGHTVEEGDKPPAEDPPVEEAPPAPAAEYVEEVASEPADGWRSSAAAKESVPEEPVFNGQAVAADPGDEWGSWLSELPKKKPKKKGRLGLKTFPVEPEPEPVPKPEPVPPPIDFPSLDLPLLAPRDNHREGCDPSQSFNPSRSYTNVFLCHALLWSLADLQEIEALKALALFKLHKILCVFEIDNLNASQAIDLVRYAYSQPKLGKRRPDDEMTGLKSLVAKYVAANSVVLSRNAGFMELLGEGGQFVKDFVMVVVERTR